MEDKIITKAQKDYKSAEQIAEKAKIDTLSTAEEFEGRLYGNERAGFSQIVKKVIAKAVVRTVPALTEPFLNTDKPVKLMKTSILGQKEFWEYYLNDFVLEETNMIDLIEDLAVKLLLSPRAWIMPIWETKYRNGKKISKGKLICPDTWRIRIDPKATSEEDANFFTYEEKVLINDLYQEAKGIEGADMSMIEKYKRGEGTVQVNETLDEQINGKSSGKDENFVNVIRYYGFVASEEKNNFETNYMEIVWIKGETSAIYKNIIDAPFDRIPLHGASFMKSGAGLMGKSLGWLLSDAQKIETGLSRGILDNLDAANNGTTYYNENASAETILAIQKGRRWVPRGEKDDISFGSYNQIPQSVFQVSANVDKESRELSGTMFNSPSVSRAQMQEDGGGQTLTVSQSQLLSTIRKLGGMLRLSLADIMMYTVWYTDQERKLELVGEIELMNVYQNVDRMRFKKQIATADSGRFESQQINMLLQQSVSNSDIVSKDIRKEIIIDLYESMNKHEMADKIRADDISPTEAEMQMQQEQMNQIALKNAKTQQEINSMQTKSAAEMQKAQNDAIRVQQEDQKIQADTYKKRADGDYQTVKTARETADAITGVTDGLSQGKEKLY